MDARCFEWISLIFQDTEFGLIQTNEVIVNFCSSGTAIAEASTTVLLSPNSQLILNCLIELSTKGNFVHCTTCVELFCLATRNNDILRHRLDGTHSSVWILGSANRRYYKAQHLASSASGVTIRIPKRFIHTLDTIRLLITIYSNILIL
jgi:hypothetical protein